MEYNDYIRLITNGEFESEVSLLDAVELKISFDEVELDQQ